MALQWALVGNIVIACAYAAITVAIVVPVRRAGQLRTNRLAVATAMIFFSCAVGHGFHALMYWQAAWNGMDMMHGARTFWPSAIWDVATAAVGVYYWSLRRGYAVLIGGALYVDPAEEQRRRDIEVRERVAEGRADAEAERDAQAAMLHAVITNSRSLIYVKDLQGRYLLVNEAFQTAFGVTEEEVLGKTDIYLDPQRAKLWRAGDRRAQAGPVRTQETAELAGGRRWFDSTKFPLFDAAGNLYAICGVSLDVTDLRAAAEEAGHARDEALAQSQIKSEFLATMSHEIRTPMNGVLGLATLLLATDLDAAQHRYAAGIHSAGKALLGVINDILDFSKIEAGKVILDPADFDLPAVLAETAALVTPAAQEKGLAVVTRRGPGLPATVRGDGGRLRQILLNLAGNAVKFTGQGSVTVRADLRREPLLVRFEVVDTGIGIDPGDAERLFEPFTQADASTTRTYGGTGLGLAISRQLTEAMGGRIGVDSEPGQGSTFWCEIPFEPAAGDVTGPAPDAAGLRILLVGTGEDRPVLQDDLRRWHMSVTGVDDGPGALAALREAAAHGRPFDLLLLDADPGDLDTAGLARMVTALALVPPVNIVVLNENAPAGADTGVGTYLPKPVHRSALYDLLAQSMAATTPAPPAPEPVRVPTTVGGTVLLVEDNDINQMVAVGILSGLGYATDVAADGQVALEMAADRRYDAILMDCRMPRMDGFTATAELRRREALGAAPTPIIAMTASALVADRDRCLAAGMDDYLAKPVNPAELAAALHRWIGAERPPAPAVAVPAPGRTALPAVTLGSGWVQRTPGVLTPARLGTPPAPVTAGHDDDDPIGRRLDELAGDHTGPERALVHRLVTSFLARAPQHLAAITDAVTAADAQVVEEQAHSLKGAAGNIGATAVMRVCERIETEARAGRLPARLVDDVTELRAELDRVDVRLRQVTAPSS